MANKKQQKGKQKAKEKAVKKLVEDKTFGLKNKKSKKAQQYIKQVKSQASNIIGRSSRDLSVQEEKKLKKLQEKQRERELKQLFGEHEKPKQEQKPEQDENPEDKTVQDVLDDLDNELRDEEEMTLEDVIEKERAKIIDGTPVTMESFTKWKEFKRQQKHRQDEVKRKLQERAFQTTGSGLSGRALFEMDDKLFVDDEKAADKSEYEIDDSLFLDDEEQNESPAEEEEEDWNPATWTDSKSPKQLLQLHVAQVLGLKNDQWPVYDEVSIVDQKGFLFYVNLPHLSKTFTPTTLYKSKKDAQNAAAYLALNFLQKQ